MKQLDPKAVWLFFSQGALAGIVLLLVIGFSVTSFRLQDVKADAFGIWFWISQTLSWIFIPLIFIIVLSYVIAKLSYHFYRYELTENGFRKEYGIIWKKYVTIPYDRIQNVDIYRGIFARLLGLSDLNIQTAGASAVVSRYGAAGIRAEGRLPGVSRVVAEQLRDELIQRARQSKNQGL